MTYVPLLAMLVILIGGCMALNEIAPPPRPPRLVHIGRVSGRDALAFGLRLPITTPEGPLLTRTVPSFYAAPRLEPIEVRLRPRPARPGLGKQPPRRLAPRPVALEMARDWTVPATATFHPQTPTPTTGELETVA